MFGRPDASQGFGHDEEPFDQDDSDRKDHVSSPWNSDFGVGSNFGEGERDESWSHVEPVASDEARWYQDARVDDSAEPCQPSASKCRRTAWKDPAPVHPAVAQALFEEKRKSSIRLPWESGFGKSIFGSVGNPLVAIPFHLPTIGRSDMFAQIAVSSSSGSDPTWYKENPFRARRLFATRMARSEDQLRSAALARIKEIVLYDPNDSKLGRSLLETSGMLVPEHQLAMTFMDAFARKSTSTLSKRSCDYLRFSRWQVQDNHARPLNAVENDLYLYVCYLRDAECAPTAPAAFISSWRFFHYMTGSNAVPDIISQRIEGAAHSCYLKKAPLRQAPPLKVPIVMRMEVIVFEGSDLHATIAGFALFCLFSVARWSDAAKATDLTIESHGAMCLVEAVMLGHKTAKLADDRATFMPLIALGHTFSSEPWASAWMSARTRSGVDAKNILMPAWSEQAEMWLDRPMTSAEGCAWLQEILAVDADESWNLDRVTTHALKSTPLSWATKSGRFDKHEKRILGHHSAPDERMIITYGRDVMAPVLSKLQHLIDLIRTDRFDPDLSRSERMANLVERFHDEDRRVEDLKRFDDSEQSDVSFADHVGIDERPSLVPGMSDRPEPPETGTFVRHRISSIVHAVMVPASLLRCGRPLNSNYDACSFDPQQPREDIFCEQCRLARVLGD
ncbi:unnamed protein product [Symbiodinium sp. CCMP2592]|nr:unnamed protein product [Symbiodinium sp. CCMP2592]